MNADLLNNASWNAESLDHDQLVPQAAQNPAIVVKTFRGRGHAGIYTGYVSPLQKMMFGAIAAMLVPFCVLLPIVAILGASDEASQFIAYGISVVCFVAYMTRNGPGVREK